MRMMNSDYWIINMILMAAIMVVVVASLSSSFCCCFVSITGFGGLLGGLQVAGVSAFLSSSSPSPASYYRGGRQVQQRAGQVMRRSSATFFSLLQATSTTETSSTAPPSREEYDLVVIGGGSGGVRASRIASGHGANVLLLEGQLKHGIPPFYSAIGGTCVNVGCVPKKLMVFASRYPFDISEAAGYGWKHDDADNKMKFDWKQFMQYKDEEITRLNNVYQNNVLKSAGVEVVQGLGQLLDKHTVQVTMTTTTSSDNNTDNDNKVLSVKAKKILIAVGGWPYKPTTIPGVEHAITSNEIFYLPQQPKRAVVVGGGFIALEFATILDGLGTDVTLMYRGDLFLRGFDLDLREHLKQELEINTNIDLQFHTNPKEIVKNNNDGSLTVKTEDGNKSIDCDCVMMATGRKGKIENLGLDNAGVYHQNSFIPVDDYSQTNIDNIYAIGDVTDRIALTPVALMEGHRFADTTFGKNMDRPVDHEYVASTVFTNPELGTVGYTEEEAAEQFKDITIFKTRFRAMKHSFPKSETYSMFKLIVDTKTDRVVGCHIASDNAGEMIQGVAIAIKMGATKSDFDATIGIHPTSAEELVTMRSPSYQYKDGKKVED